ncbi:MAG: hypothetical protein IT559_00385 [Alphaproteobacteria bacterium]|nr:hypothetical protein [Alphaproteobacteria bacterium]
MDDDISFYALAYDYNGKKIISYRGTDDPFGSWTSLWTDGDVWNGWFIGGGSTQARQAQMAFAFYHNVIGGQENSYTADISFTGHSLGGGLGNIYSGDVSLTGHSLGGGLAEREDMLYAKAVNDNEQDVRKAA